MKNILICIFLILAVGIVITLKLYNIHLNLSHSMPIGFYQIRHSKDIHRGDFVSSCLPKRIAEHGLQRTYLPKGKCPSGNMPVLKQVIAVPDDDVELSDDAIIVNGQAYKAPVQKVDHDGLAMTRFIQPGQYHHVKDYWLYGFNDPIYSWDSRYFGGIDEVKLVKRLTWFK